MKFIKARMLVITAMSLAPLGSQAKYCDNESDLIYYGYRYYSPAHGRWLGRDPSVEKAFAMPNPQLSGEQLLAKAIEPTFLFVNNDAINQIDTDGQDRWACWSFGHKFVVVQTWSGGQPSGYLKIDFGPAGSDFAALFNSYVPGVVQLSLSGSKPGFWDSPIQIKSSPQADRILQQWASNVHNNGDLGYSLVNFNCISFANLALQMGIDNIVDDNTSTKDVPYSVDQ